MAIYALARRGPVLFGMMRAHWHTGLAGGALQFGSYGIAIWAMTLAPIAIVAALRETSVLFGAVIAVVVLKEPLRANRVDRGDADRGWAGADAARLSAGQGSRSPRPHARRRSRSSGTIDVPQRHRLLPGQPRLSKPAAGFIHHLRRAPGHVREQCGLGPARADQHIAAILGRKHHHIDAAAQDLGGGPQIVGD